MISTVLQVCIDQDKKRESELTKRVHNRQDKIIKNKSYNKFKRKLNSVIYY
jgi:hypothetical protein